MEVWIALGFGVTTPKAESSAASAGAGCYATIAVMLLKSSGTRFSDLAEPDVDRLIVSRVSDPVQVRLIPGDRLPANQGGGLFKRL